MDLFTSTNMYVFSKTHSQSLHKNLCLTIFHLVSNTIRACRSLGHHILALESDMEVFIEALEFFIEVATLKLDTNHVHNFEEVV